MRIQSTVSNHHFIFMGNWLKGRMWSENGWDDRGLNRWEEFHKESVHQKARLTTVQVFNDSWPIMNKAWWKWIVGRGGTEWCSEIFSLIGPLGFCRHWQSWSQVCPLGLQWPSLANKCMWPHPQRHVIKRKMRDCAREEKLIKSLNEHTLNVNIAVMNQFV